MNLGIGLRGLWTTRIIVITTLLIGIFFVFLSAKNVLNKIEKWYFSFFSFLPILTVGFMLIPFFGAVATISLFGQLFCPADKIFYEDNKLRIQSTFIGVLGPPRIDVYEKVCLYEKHLKRSDFWITSNDSISVSLSYDPDSTRVTLHRYLENSDEEEMEVICLDKIEF
jgi:cytochrome b subunit of formate dehydrogenase